MKASKIPDKLITAKTAANITGYSEAHIINLAKNGKFVPIISVDHLGAVKTNRYMFKHSEVIDWDKQNRSHLLNLNAVCVHLRITGAQLKQLVRDKLFSLPYKTIFERDKPHQFFWLTSDVLNWREANHDILDKLHKLNEEDRREA